MMNQSLQSSNNEKLTRQQQKALHLFFRQVSEAINAEGIGMALILQKFILDVPATPYLVKEMWRMLQDGMLGKKSTTELLKKQEIDKVYDALNKFLSQEMEVEVPPFPSYSEISFTKEYDNKM
jgi:hypothetical protein